MALSKTRQEKYKQARDRAKQLGRQIETDQTNRRQSSVGNGSAPSVPGPLGSSSQNAKNRLSGRGVSGVSGSFPVSDAGTAAYERGVVSAITRQRDEAKADQLRAQARLQALSAGGWSADSPQARQAERETWNSLNASARQKAASERLKEIAASAQERYAREQAVRTARLPDADTLESRLEQAARERYQAEADIQRYSGLGLVLSPGGITENAGRLQEAVRAVEPAKERQEALRKDFDAVRNRDYNREQENQINEWIRSTPAGQGTAPDFSTATTPKQWQAAGAVRILLNPDRAAQTVSTGNAEGTWDATRLSFLTEEEKRAVLAYANAGDWETAANLLEALERTLNARQQESANERLYEESKEHPIVGAAANAILSYGQPYAYLEGVRQVVENAATGNYEPIDPNSFAMSGANLVQQTGQGVVDAVNGFFGKDVSFLTQTGLSILQNMARAPIAWVNPMASLGIMATGAGGASVLEGAQAGKDPAKTVALATAAGLAEYVTERVSLESLLETLKAGKTPLRQALFRVGKQMITEGSEEAASEYLNLLADAVISGASSGMMQERDALMAAGFSRSEADAMAMTKYMAEQPALSALGGMISGGVMGGGAAALGSAMGALDERAQRQANRTADAAIDASYAEMQENGLFGQSGEQRQRTQAAIERARQADGSGMAAGAAKNTASTRETALQADTALFDRSILKNFNQARKSFLDFARSHFPAKVQNAETGREISISRTGLDKFLSGNLYFEKYASGFHIPELIEQAHKVGEAADNKGRDSILGYEYYDSPIDIESKPYTAHIRVRNTRSGDKYYGHTISEIDQIEIEPSTREDMEPMAHPVNIDGSTSESSQDTGHNTAQGSPVIYARSEPPQSSSTPMITELGLERNGLTREQVEIIARIASGETVNEEEARSIAESDAATSVLTRAAKEQAARQRTGASAATSQQQERTQETQAYRRQAPTTRAEAQVIEASSVFGENGRRASRAAYDGSISADRYVSGFAEYYEAGLSGLSMDEVQGRYGRALNEAQRLAAYDSGQRDAAAKLREERARAQYASTAGTGSGLVLDSYVQQNLDDATVNRLNAVSKALGVRVQFADRVRGGTANAQISGADIFVEKGNPNPVLFVVGHEWTHRMQELAPEQYRAFRSAIAGEIQYDARELMARYKEQGVSLTMEEALDEAAADYAGRLLEDGALLDDFIEKHRSDRSLLEKLRDAVRTLIRKLTGKEKQLAETAEGKLTAALEAAGRQAERLQGQQRNDTMGQTRNSLKEDLTDGGERREETREAFARRAAGEGLTVVEGKTAAFGYREPIQLGHETVAGQVREELQRLGITGIITDGSVLWNRNSITGVRQVKEAVTAQGEVIFINSGVSLPAKRVAGHEAFHLWRNGTGRDAYIEIVEDNLLFTSEAFLEYQSAIAEAYLGEEVDLSNDAQVRRLREELFAYISGDIHEGTNDEALRPMFRDYDAVKAAWEALVEENRGEAEETGRYSLKAGDGSRDAAQLRREADLLRDRVEYWKGQTRKSGEISIDGKATRRAARAILRQFSSSLDTDTLTESMTDLYNYMLRGGEDFSETEAYRKAEAIARQVVDGALEADDSLYSQYADLRAYLRNTPLSISETDRHDIADFNDFRKRNFGRLNIRAKGGTNIDQIYAELSAQWPEFFDQSRESHPADQLLRMAEVAEQLRQVDVRNPFSDSYWEAVQGAANELYQQFFDTPQAKKTFADRQAAKLDAERAKGRRRAAEQRERVERQLETVRQQNRERVQRAVQRERETRQRQVERLKDRYAEKTAADRERRSAAELRRKITRHAKALSTQLLKPSNQQHVPERLRTAVAATLDAINQESLFTYDRSTGKRQKNQPGAPAKRTEAFLALREAYQAILTDNSQSMAIDPDLQGRLDELITLRDTPLSAMNTGQLTTVWNTLKAVEASVRNANRMLSGEQWETVARTAEALRRENVHKAQRRDLTGALGKLDRAVNLNNLTPEAFFHRLGATGEQLFEMLRKAQDRYITTVAKAQEEMAALVSGRVVQQLEREVHTFRLEQGGAVTLSTAQIMALRETMQDKQGRKHVLNGGIRPDNVQQRRGVYQTATSRSYRVTAGDLDAILSTLTKEQEALASRLQKYLAERMGETGNEASMQVYGYRKFTDPNYFPLESDRNQVRGGETEPGGGAVQGSSIENMGLAKARVENATNGVMVRSIFDVVSNHISDMATYGAYLPAMTDLQRVYNYQFFRRDGGEGAVRDGSVKDVFTQVFGAGGNAYMSKLLQDINRSSRSENMSPLSTLTGNYKAAAIAFNMRVVLQQPTAILRALSELDAKYLTAGMVRRGDWEKVKRYAPIAVWKDWGYFDINTGRQMKNVLFSDDSRLERLKQAGMAMASRADSFAWSRLWNAVELEIKDTRSDLTPGSSAFYEAVAERFEGIIDKTQVVDGVLQRSQIMRSTSDLDKMAASFMGEPTKVYNMLMSAIYDYRNAEGAAKQAAGKHLARTVFALTVSFAVNAVMQSVMDALRDDDREKDYWEKFFAAYTGFSGEEETFLDYWNSFWDGNLQANYNPLSYVPYVKDILSLLQGYDVKRMDLESISKVLTAGQGALRALQGNGKNTRASAFATLFAEVSRLLGLPVANLKRDVQAVVNTAANETDNYLLQYRMDKAMLDINYDGNRKNFLDLLYKAYENDREAYEIMYEDMVMSGFDPEAIRKGMESRMKKEQGVESVEDLTERYLTPEQERTYDRLYGELSSSRVWRAADDGQRAEVEDNLYQLAVKTDAGQRLQEKIDGGAAYGVSEADYLLYLAALEVADAENEDRSKRNGATDQREAEAAANMLAGLSDEGRAYLWQSTNKGWKESSNPFR